MVVAGIYAAAIPVAHAQESTPDKEPTLAEAKAAFAKADRALNQAWSAAKAATSGATLAELTQKQREWLEFRDYRAGYESEQSGQKDPKRSAVWHTTAAGLTESRIEWLRGWTETTKKSDETLTGEWSDSYGGRLYLFEQPAADAAGSAEGRAGRLLFSIEVVRGPTYHTGSVAGVASWNHPIGWWSDKGRDAEKTDETNLAFVARENTLEVIGANTTGYHGVRAHFDGVYVKVTALDDATRAELIKAAESGEPLVEADETADNG